MKLSIDHGRVEGWICNCDPHNAYNDILRRYCVYCKAHRDEVESYIQFEIACAFRRGVFYAYEGGSPTLTNEDRKEKYSEFYGRSYNEALNVELMPMEALIASIEELEDIILTAKASKDGKDTAKRERIAKLSKEEREKLISNPNVGEGIMVPKVRKDRMTAKEKLAADLAAIMGDEDTLSILGTVKVTETAQGSLTAKEEIRAKAAGETTFTFNTGEKQSRRKDDEEKKEVLNPAKITQESLLADLLSRVDCTSSDLKRLTETYNTAAILVGKTVNKLQPDKMILLGSRIAELTLELEAKVVEKKEITPVTEPSTGTFSVDVSKLFGK